jgi:hypothetical protein
MGTAGHLIGGMLVADVQVSFENGPPRDLIKKIHAVAPNVAIGFSGSVFLGFRMVESLRTLVASQYKDVECVPTDALVRDWRPRAVAEWGATTDDQRALGCSLLMVGAQAKRGILNRNTGYCLRGPDFVPHQFGKKPFTIGSGSDVAAYRAVLEKGPWEWSKMLRQFNLRRGGPLDPFGTIMGKTIERNPKRGISPHLHLCVVRCDDFIWGTNDRTLSSGVHWVMPQVASDYASYRQMCNSTSIASGSAGD